MRKCFTSAICILSGVTVMLCVAGCAKKNVAKDNSVSIADSNGTSYFAVTDKNGFIEYDDKDKMIIYPVLNGEKVTDVKSGEYITQSVNFPYYAVCGNKIFTKNYNFTVPEEWKMVKGENVKIEYNKDKIKAELSIIERVSESKSECIINIKQTMSVLGISPQKTTVKHDWGDATVLTYKEYKKNSDLIFSVFTVKDKTYYVKISATKNAEKTVDFNKIIGSIIFR